MTEHFAKVPPRVAADFTLGAQDLRVLIAICSHANGGGRAYPSLARIASLTGIARHNVCRSIGRIEKAGYLRRQRRQCGNGVWDRSTYEIIFNCPTAPAQIAEREALNGAERSARVMTLIAVNDRETPRGTGDAHFELFWRAYPSRGSHPNPKKPAALKFAAALKRGVDPSIIIAGAKQYADYVELENIDPRYVKQAVTWLNQEQWNEAYKAPKVRPTRARVGAI